MLKSNKCNWFSKVDGTLDIIEHLVHTVNSYKLIYTCNKYERLTAVKLIYILMQAPRLENNQLEKNISTERNRLN